ncbi:MAG: hypothetical protein A2504_13410 [Bdellovibrionales bacterium RIFOXYD12_FULL_39_22]|nr:MAG: hypothetical protein A2385_01210 [Bdellovibrionales bacterium RIFOXYB1_FULL_39_21]OFZ43624.1 MAG: hypothetical protein A2485_12880 [Bdellovibrionales bacterium RIFOXYC12_FULL_39_17]OFZ44643.1 MAG: hypothetical protein A2404_10570 [Bdellovibrionales bacterium RIFOXYC1_FULL_39_130]OFZ73686.1 MAG: hypothetical protein A2451_01375 [Bdellovibrionales bacterium RIFOXYC2_FULL_39_8]OFZ76402.1 MAG: hypothetical protein A2560_07190 [Bdellovibrionales bacterium RIFOXYD1_FULL_39_84]OFZ94668.1 MAG:
MKINIYDYDGKRLAQIDGHAPIYITNAIESLPIEKIPFRENIDILRTLQELNEQQKMKAESIMMIDDDLEFLEISKHWIAKLGHYVETFTNAEAAFGRLRKFVNNRYDRIIVDNRMPDISGASLVKTILKLKVTAKIQILSANIAEVPRDISSKIMIIQKPCNMVNIVGAASKAHVTKGEGG